MTIKELIEELQDYPQDAQVITTYWIVGDMHKREPILDYDEETNILEIN